MNNFISNEVNILIPRSNISSLEMSDESKINNTNCNECYATDRCEKNNFAGCCDMFAQRICLCQELCMA